MNNKQILVYGLLEPTNDLTEFLPSQGSQESQGIWKLFREYQRKSENSIDVREKSGNFTSSCVTKENDSFWK